MSSWFNLLGSSFFALVSVVDLDSLLETSLDVPSLELLDFDLF